MSDRICTMPGCNPARVKHIAVFGHDANESTIRKRIRAFQNEGVHVTGFTFARRRAGLIDAPSWDNVELGSTVDRNYLRRIPTLLRAVLLASRRARTLRKADVIYARNIDMLAVAVAV